MSEIPARFNDGGAVSGRGGEERKKGLGFVMGEVRRDAIVVAEKEKERVKPYIYIYSINIYIYVCVCVFVYESGSVFLYAHKLLCCWSDRDVSKHLIFVARERG